MQQQDPVKIEIWLDNSFYDKIDVAAEGYDVVTILEDLKTKMKTGLIPTAFRVELRRAII